MSEKIYNITPEEETPFSKMVLQQMKDNPDNRWWEDNLQTVHPDDYQRFNLELSLLTLALHEGKLEEVCATLNTLRVLWPYKET